MKKAYEKPCVLETMTIEEVMMDEEFAPEWINWKQSWNNGWNNSGVFKQAPKKPAEEGEK